MWLFKGLVKKLFPILSADTNALLTSTFAFTVINGGNQTNVIPNHVEANLNVRVASFNTPEEVVNHVKKVIKDKDIVEDLIQLQKEEEVKDIELLWRATIDNNSLIKFTMNKLSWAPKLCYL